jgi:signal transduction histidine kinase
MGEVKIRDGFFKIRPAGRHIVTIGRDLIKDQSAAIVELVKNAYDADATFCTISLLPISNEKGTGIKVIVKDDGHGMTFETVVDKWMVPSTNDKMHRDLSPKGRVLQGKKGIGRYSASIIGNDLVLQTVDSTGDLTTLYLIWEHFEAAKYLEDVDVLIENYISELPHGTEIIMVGDNEHLMEWNEKNIRSLITELRKLMPPKIENDSGIDPDKFQIKLSLGNFPFELFRNIEVAIEPFPIMSLYDYRIFGEVDENGNCKLFYENSRIPGNRVDELTKTRVVLNRDLGRKAEQKFCGSVNLDFRVYDRDPSSIDSLIERGLKDPVSGASIGKRDARRILDVFNGIGVYRNGFRIRPLGDAGYDWIELDRSRVQNPSVKIGSDQVIGFVHIQSEPNSFLLEKSARDGLKENAQYFGLIEICRQVLTILEQKRFIYRQSVGLGRSKRGLEAKINRLFSFADLREKIDVELDLLGVSEAKKGQISKIIDEKEEVNNKIAEDLKQTIALYQGQATLGKIVDVVLHEGKKPLAYFLNQLPNIKDWAYELQTNPNTELMEKVVQRLGTLAGQVEIFVQLFNRLDPLSTKRRDKKKEFALRPVLQEIADVYAGRIKQLGVIYTITCPSLLQCYGWKEDYYIVFTNLIDNSLYWLQEVTLPTRSIAVVVDEDDELITIEFRDNGPGIAKELIESQVIFEPEFSLKSGNGSGLGLAIAGEAIERNDGELRAVYSEHGAFFKIEIKKT